LRDVSKVFQGMCIVKKQYIQNKSVLVRLWIHEMNRVFRDRLIDKKDLNDFDSMIKNAITNKLDCKLE